MWRKAALIVATTRPQGMPRWVKIVASCQHEENFRSFAHLINMSAKTKPCDCATLVYYKVQTRYDAM
jgi:hypothetical protein